MNGSARLEGSCSGSDGERDEDDNVKGPWKDKVSVKVPRSTGIQAGKLLESLGRLLQSH